MATESILPAPGLSAPPQTLGDRRRALSLRHVPTNSSRPLRHLALFALVLSAALPACSSDDEPSPGANPPVGQPEAGSDGATQDATEDTSETGQPDAAADADVVPPVIALFTASDFAATAELVAVDLTTGTASSMGSLAFDDQDSIVAADHGRAFVLHRGQGRVSVLDTSGQVKVIQEIDLQPTSDAGGKANPSAVIVPAANKAYVLRYGQNTLTVLDPNAGGGITGELDLSEFVADPDGLVDAFAGVFDVESNRAYIGLQRIDQNEFGAPPDYVGACSATRAAIVGIDTTTDTIVDLNGSADGKAIELSAVNPAALLWDAAGARLLALGVGCANDMGDGGSTRSGRGVEAVDPTTGSASWLWQTDDLRRPAALVWIGPNEAVVGLDDESFMRHWFAWDPGAAALGEELSGVPDVPTWDGNRSLVGLAISASDGGAALDVVSYDLDSKAATVVLPAPFTSVGLFAYSSATLR